MTELSSIIFLIWLIPVTVFILMPLSTMCGYLLLSAVNPFFHKVQADRFEVYAGEEIKAA